MGGKSALADVKPDPDARARIVAAARGCFATVGFEGASTRQIAAEAGVAQSLLLYHFGTKDTLWRCVIDDLFERLNERVGAVQRTIPEASVKERLAASIRVFIALCAEDADLHRIMTIEGRRRTDRLKWLVERHLRRNFTQTCTLIRSGQEEGVVRDGDPTLLYYSFIAIAGTAFSLAPEIRMVSRNERAVDVRAIESLIEALLFVNPTASKARGKAKRSSKA